MKPGKWLAVLLVLLIGAIILIQRQKRETARTAESAPPVAAEKNAVGATSSNNAIVENAALPIAEADTQSVKVPDALENANHLQVIVQNETGQPLEGASVQTSFRGEQRRPALTNLNRTFTTSAHGMTDVLWPVQKFEQFELLISKDDYSPRKVLWDRKSGDDIPGSYTVRLKSSVHVGGFVVDPEGNPVADAMVTLSRFWTSGDSAPYRKGEEAAFPTQRHITGTDGRWTARNLPSELLDRIGIEASHTNFIGVRVTMESKPEIEQELREGKYKLQLARGLEVRGRVINEQQQPIAGTQVWVGRKYRRERQETTTDAQGRFSFRNVNEGKLDFSAMADGYAPAYKTHEVGAQTEEVLFQLAKGSVIRGTVQDEASQPLEGVRVVLEGSPGDPSYDRFTFSATTDSEGKFEWKSAPNEPMPFYFGKSGYEQKRNFRLKPAEDNVITLRHSRQIIGHVLNADTDQPITNFTVTVGRFITVERFFRSSSSDTKEFKSDQGAFVFDLNEEEHGAVEVAAVDYAEKAQALPAAENGEIHIVVKLKPVKALRGTVVTEDDQPVSGASVAIVDSEFGGRTIQLTGGRLRSNGSRAVMATTDANGQFAIASPPEAGMVVAASGSAYGSASVADVQASGLLKVHGFGRIEGMFIRGSGGVAGQELLLSSASTGVSYEYESSRRVTGPNGEFTFEKVPAGTNTIVRLVQTSARSRIHSHRTEVVVTSGQTTTVVLGGADATVQAQVKFETTPAETDYIMSAQLSTVQPQVPQGLTPEQRQEFYKSPEWKQQVQNMKHYSAVVAGDGSIVLDSVMPGEYTLKVTAVKSDDDSIGARKPLAQGETKITVPAGTGPNTPLHAGEVLLKLSR
jgi:hypothetical protein